MGGLQLHGVLGDGSLIVSRGYNPRFYQDPRLERDTVHYLIVPPAARSADTIIALPGTETFVTSLGDASMRRDRAFGRVAVIAVRPSDILTGTADRYELEVRARDGRLRELWRLPDLPTRVTSAEIARFKEERLAEARSARFPGAPPGFAEGAVERARVMYEQMPFPETHPAYDSLLVATTGEVWVRDPAPFRDDARRWTVFSAGGAALGIVTTPPRMRLFEVGRGYVLALMRDEDDVEHVAVFPLTRLARD
jgi:hypothetical protein